MSKFQHPAGRVKLVVARARLVVGQAVLVSMSADWTRPCPGCGETQHLELRQTADGTVREQPKCSACRHKPKGT